MDWIGLANNRALRLQPKQGRRVGLGWVGLGWVGLGWVGLGWPRLACDLFFLVCNVRLSKPGFDNNAIGSAGRGRKVEHDVTSLGSVEKALASKAARLFLSLSKNNNSRKKNKKKQLQRCAKGTVQAQAS